jgi:hypothetical protein
MPDAAPRIPWPLVEALARMDEPGLPIAEVWRRACAYADEHGFTRPSYEQIRRLTHRERALRALPGPLDPLIDGWLRARSPESAVNESMRRHRERTAARSDVRAERTWRPAGGEIADS